MDRRTTWPRITTRSPLNSPPLSRPISPDRFQWMRDTTLKCPIKTWEWCRIKSEPSRILPFTWTWTLRQDIKATLAATMGHKSNNPSQLWGSFRALLLAWGMVASSASTRQPLHKPEMVEVERGCDLEIILQMIKLEVMMDINFRFWSSTTRTNKLWQLAF